ncbi:hypothetical protein Agub_g6272, partial [Astrephomene gubernaculifera]
MAHQPAAQAFYRFIARGVTRGVLGRQLGDLSTALPATCRHLSSGAAAPATSALLDHIKAKILVRGGPISMAEYMQDCLTSPQGGFYMGRDVFGSAGDFVTSPEISQVFGELIGIWCVHTWMSLGQPARLQLVELGPGRGTLMADLLRGTRAFRPFSSSLELHLVEVSPALRQLQWRALGCRELTGVEREEMERQEREREERARQRSAASEAEMRHLRTGLPPLVGQGQGQEQQGQQEQGRGATPGLVGSSRGGAAAAGGGGGGEGEGGLVGVCGFNGCRVHWHSSLDSVPEGPGPALVVAHEFLDALPVHQFVRDPARGWLEKMVDLQEQ